MLGFSLNQPFEQFEIFIFDSINFIVSLNENTDAVLFFFNWTNYILYYLVIMIVFTVLFDLNNATKQPGREIFYKPFSMFAKKFQFFIERVYFFIFELIYQQIGFFGQLFVPLFITLFSLILIANMIGIIPYSFTLTSHIMLTFTLSFSVFIGLTVLAIINQPNFFSLFMPKGVPGALVPFLFVFEVISYVSRTFSLAIRLFANMMSGHVLLYILTNFCSFLYANFFGLVGKIVFVIPLLLIIAITGLETGIAILQAYIFCVLISIYFCDVYLTNH